LIWTTYLSPLNLFIITIMEYKTLGQSDIKVSELAFGAWAIGGWMWGGADSKDAIRAVETAVDHGMTTIDTAAVYGFGLSEELTGKAIISLLQKITREGILISTAIRPKKK